MTYERAEAQATGRAVKTGHGWIVVNGAGTHHVLPWRTNTLARLCS
jgi:hypothetical protein